MRREALKLSLLAATVVASGQTIATMNPAKDTRLLGTWLSDKERTVGMWRYRKELTDEQRAKFEAIFGKFRKRFTATHVHTEFEGDKTTTRYKVVAADSRSVVVSFPDEKSSNLQQLFFEDGGWMYVFSGYNVEFFRRVEA
jgi:Spy/CpxP family protein refolding chaperone